MKKILMTLFTLIAFIGSANTDSLTDTDKAAQKALAEQYVQALKDKDMNVVNQLIDYDVYADNMLKNLSVTDELSKKYKLTFIKEQKSAQEFYSNNAYITLMGKWETPNFSGYLIRFINKDYSPNYMGLVTKKVDEKWKIVDFYSVVGKEISSHYIAKMFKQMFLGNDNISTRLEKNYSILDKEKLILFFKYKKNKQFIQAVKTYRSFSDKLKKEEVIVDLGLDILNYFTDEKFYNELFTILGKYHQNNPEYYIQLFNYFLINKEYGKAREIVKDFFSYTSDNAMMNFTLASVSLTEENYSRALKEFKQCAEAEPNLQPCYDMWIGIADTIKNYDEEVLAYQTASKNLGVDLSKSMFNEQENGDFMRSDAFKNWDIPEN